MIHFAKNEETGRTRGAPKKRVAQASELAVVPCLCLFDLPEDRERERKRKKGKGGKREKRQAPIHPGP